MPNKITKKKANRAQNHIYRGIDELIVDNAGLTTPNPMPLAANSTSSYTLCPQGMVSTKFSSGTFTNSTIETPHLKWLATTSLNFKEYRILRASLRFVGNVPSTATGNFSVVSSKDYADIFAGTQVSYATSGSGYSVASLANKDRVVPLTINSTWKPVTSRLLTSDIATSTVLVPLNTVDDVLFSVFAVSNNSTSALGIVYLNYDVEFRGPINPTLNA